MSRTPGNDPRAAEGLRPVINVSGTMTSLGASIAVPDAIGAMAAMLPHFVEIGDLQRKASAEIARACGSEAGFVTASASAGITLAVAGCMTGADLAAIERLPDTARLEKTEVVVQAGHLVHYGAPVDQAVRLAGARVVPVGTATLADAYQLAGAITERTAAALYVVSHHVVGYGQIPFDAFVKECRARGVPVIVDAASEYDLRGFVERGADVALYSAHKFLGGPTAGIVAGRKDLVRAAYLQNVGIGRGMKVGKEGVIGAMAALRTWEKRDHAAMRAREDGILRHWTERLDGVPGLATAVDPDPTGNPLSRLRVTIDPAQARITAWDLADALAAGDPPVIVRDHEVEHGYFHLDPCNLHPGQETLVAERLLAECERARARNEPPAADLAGRRARQTARLLAWPD
ncbi:aminotransferase class V-fold PLP-dependent enzyme [Arenibaculum sp.]|jgi:L-seryl-tRNA(Ser) seleniumtransferase|uniref:aminotransferase class V-fold PLP-dependent enzyme n=1 Tax=Arenibaculum sp. TaxID=2865862 RepID=UPI002E0F46AF|nr:aminotransferase class V-fold PLP-dependent enzyme [Arenibaculum sp.]